MFCCNCGAKVVEADKFCAMCGTPVEAVHEEEQIMELSEFLGEETEDDFSGIPDDEEGEDDDYDDDITAENSAALFEPISSAEPPAPERFDDARFDRYYGEEFCSGLASGLPEWDIVPPDAVVRRKRRRL